MKVAVVGSRDYPDLDAVERFIEGLPPDTTVISGGARGVDRRAESVARRRGLRVEVWEAWSGHGTFGVSRVEMQGWASVMLPVREGCPSFRDAALWRNRQMVEAADEVVAFWDGKSSGTRYTINYARATGVPVKVWDE